MTTMRGSTMRGRELGWRLREAMRAADLTGHQVAARLGVSQSQTSRTLSGHRGIDPAELGAWLAICGVTGAERDQILALCQQASDAVRLEGAQRWISLREHVSQAREVAEFAPAMVPWGMQIPSYTCTLADVMGLTVDVTTAWNGYRIRLVRPTDKSPTGMWSAVLHEHVLRTVVGDRQVMSDQLHRLLQLSVHPAMSLQVLPASAGAHAGMAGGSMMLEFADLPAVVYREDAHAGVFAQTRDVVQQARAAMTNLRHQALNTLDSRELIRDLAAELYAERGPVDELVGVVQHNFS